MDPKLLSIKSEDQLPITIDKLSEFLVTALGEYSDTYKQTLTAIEHTFKRKGWVIIAMESNEIIGSLVLNKTEMDGYAPENFLIYIGVLEEHRRKGIAEKMIAKALEVVNGSIYAHIDYDNKQSSKLFEKMGFASIYKEVRLERNTNF